MKPCPPGDDPVQCTALRAHQRFRPNIAADPHFFARDRGALPLMVTTMKPRTLPILVLALLALTAAAPTTQPGVGVVIPAGITRPVMQRKINDAAARGLPLTLDAGTYKIDKTIVVPPGLVMRANGTVVLVGVTPGIAILHLPTDPNGGGGTRIDGLTFRADAAGVTGIDGDFLRAEITHCVFWTTIDTGLGGTALDTYVEKCSFGLSGPVMPHFTQIRFRGGGTNNKIHIRDSRLYYATGDAGIDVGEGYLLEITGCNIEHNLSRVAVRCAGMFGGRIAQNWFENNAGESQIEFTDDASKTIGSYAFTVENNFFNLNGQGNKQAMLTQGACHVRFDDNTGTSWGGKQIASEMEKVEVGHHWLVGLADPSD